MGIEVSWDNEERTVIRQTFQDKWDWDDYRAMLNETKAMLDSVDYKVSFIADARSMRWLPPRPTTVFRDIASHFQHPNWGTTVVITDSILISTFASVFFTLYPGMSERIILVTSEEEAYRRLSENRRADHP